MVGKQGLTAGTTVLPWCEPSKRDRDTPQPADVRFLDADEAISEPQECVRPVRVCFMIDELTSAGTESQLVALIENLDRSRVQPFLCLLRGESERSRALEPNDCQVLRLGITSFREPAFVCKAWRLSRWLRSQQIEVAQMYFPESTYLGVPVARAVGIKHIVRTRNNLGYWMTPLHRWLGRICNCISHVTVANCEACRQAVLNDEMIAPEKVVVLENGVDLSRFAALPEWSNFDSARPKRVGVVANLRPVKDLHLLIRAAAANKLTHPGVTYHFAGEGELRGELEALASKLGVREQIFLPGTVQDIPAFLGNLDLAVLCSRTEGMSNALLEYMAAGRGIIATEVGGNKQLIEDGVHGLLVPPGDDNKLASALGLLLTNPALIKRLGRMARQRAQGLYSREAMVRRFETFYLQLAGRSING